MVVGIPRAMLYYKNEKMWTTFFDEIGISYVISPETNREIINNGANLAIDESCLPTKILLGHIAYLIGKCDYIFVPRVEFASGYQMCTKFLSLPDLVKNTFRDQDIKILFYNIYKNKPHAERKAFYKMGKFLGVKRSQVKYAYMMGKQAQMFYNMFREKEQERILNESDKKKVLIVAHAYNIGDLYVGSPVIKELKNLGCEPIIAEYANAGECIHSSISISKTLPWAYNKHLLGALDKYKDKVDGVILLTTFPCGPDSMFNDMIIRKYKSLPIVTLTVDTQDGTAGMQTRLESFVDIINFKRESKDEK